VVTVLGSYRRTLSPGFHLESPMAKLQIVDLRSQVIPVPAVNVYGPEGRTSLLPADLRLRVADAAKALFQVREYPVAGVQPAPSAIANELNGKDLTAYEEHRAAWEDAVRAGLGPVAASWGIVVEGIGIRKAGPSGIPGPFPGSARPPAAPPGRPV
jgi:SPFH domain / Band 7 family